MLARMAGLNEGRATDGAGTGDDVGRGTGYIAHEEFYLPLPLAAILDHLKSGIWVELPGVATPRAMINEVAINTGEILVVGETTKGRKIVCIVDWAIDGARLDLVLFSTRVRLAELPRPSSADQVAAIRDACSGQPWWEYDCDWTLSHCGEGMQVQRTMREFRSKNGLRGADRMVQEMTKKESDRIVVWARTKESAPLATPSAVRFPSFSLSDGLTTATSAVLNCVGVFGAAIFFPPDAPLPKVADRSLSQHASKAFSGTGADLEEAAASGPARLSDADLPRQMRRQSSLYRPSLQVAL
jgi:hypothetical protein